MSALRESFDEEITLYGQKVGRIEVEITEKLKVIAEIEKKFDYLKN